MTRLQLKDFWNGPDRTVPLFSDNNQLTWLDQKTWTQETNSNVKNKWRYHNQLASIEFLYALIEAYCDPIHCLSPDEERRKIEHAFNKGILQENEPLFTDRHIFEIARELNITFFLEGAEHLSSSTTAFPISTSLVTSSTTTIQSPELPRFASYPSTPTPTPAFKTSLTSTPTLLPLPHIQDHEARSPQELKRQRLEERLSNPRSLSTPTSPFITITPRLTPKATPPKQATKDIAKVENSNQKMEALWNKLLRFFAAKYLHPSDSFELSNKELGPNAHHSRQILMIGAKISEVGNENYLPALIKIYQRERDQQCPSYKNLWAPIFTQLDTTLNELAKIEWEEIESYAIHYHTQEASFTNTEELKNKRIQRACLAARRQIPDADWEHIKPYAEEILSSESIERKRIFFEIIATIQCLGVYGWPKTLLLFRTKPDNLKVIGEAFNFSFKYFHKRLTQGIKHIGEDKDLFCTIIAKNTNQSLSKLTSYFWDVAENISIRTRPDHVQYLKAKRIEIAGSFTTQTRTTSV